MQFVKETHLREKTDNGSHARSRRLHRRHAWRHGHGPPVASPPPLPSPPSSRGVLVGRGGLRPAWRFGGPPAATPGVSSYAEPAIDGAARRATASANSDASPAKNG